MTNNPKKIKIDSKMVPFSLRERLHELTGNEFKLWMCLYLHSDRDGEAYPSNKVIMKETGISERNLVRLKQSLRKKGWLPKSTQRYRDNGTLSTMNEKVSIPAKLAPTDTCQDGTHSPANLTPISLPNVQGGYLPKCGGLEVPTVEVPNIEEPNSEDELVSKSVSSVRSLRSLTTTSLSGEGGVSQDQHTPTTNSETTNSKSNSKSNGNTADDSQWEERDPVIVRLTRYGFEHIWKVPCWDVLHDEFGLTASIDETVYQRILDIHEVMCYERMDAEELRRLIRWALQHKFWKTRILSVESLGKAMFRGILSDDTGGVHEKGLVPQFRREAKNKAIKQRQLDTERYKGIQARRQYRRDSGNDHSLDLKDDINAEVVVVGKGFDVEDAE